MSGNAFGFDNGEYLRSFAEVEDPGDAGVIRTGMSGRSYMRFLSGAGAETRVLRAPAFIGQEFMMFMHTDGGGNIVVTSDVMINVGNNTIMTFGDVGDTIQLTGIETSTGLRWSSLDTQGVSLS